MGGVMEVQWYFFSAAGTGTILDLEFARTHAQAVQVVKNWQKGAVVFNTVLDYTFLVAYGRFFYLARHTLGPRLGGGWAGGTRWAKWLAPLAGVCDAVKNLLMLLF
jgi:hypothetical protein